VVVISSYFVVDFSIAVLLTETQHKAVITMTKCLPVKRFNYSNCTVWVPFSSRCF